MSGLAKWIFRSSFFLGCMLGAMIATSIPRAAHAVAPPPPSEEDYLRWSGARYSTWTEPMREAWEKSHKANDSLAEAAFGPTHRAGLFYRVSTEIDGPGVYDGTAHDGTPFVLSIFVSTEALTELSTGEAFEGEGSGRYVFGEIQGRFGNMGVRGVIAATTREGGVRDQMFFVDDVLSAAETGTWRSTGIIAIAAKEPEKTTANEHNLLAANGQTQAEAKNCLKPDLLTAAACIAGVVAAFLLCHKLGMAATIAGMIKCAALLSIPFFGVAAAAICVAAVIALRIASINACKAALATALAACLAEWGLDIANCKLEELVGW
jgi:hypothetical protein